jgi:hypothetical protein
MTCFQFLIVQSCSFSEENNGRSIDGHNHLDMKVQLSSAVNDTTSTHRYVDAGLIRYIVDGFESTIPFLSQYSSNTSALYCGDQVRNDTLNVECLQYDRVSG